MFWSDKKKSSKGDQLALCMNSSYFGFFAHAGFLLELDRLGLQPGHVAGASAGALVTGCYAAGLQTERMVQLFLQKGLARGFLEWSFLKHLWGLVTHKPGYSGVLQGTGLRALLERELGDLMIEECPRARLSIAATNMTRGQQEILEQGNLAAAILASCAVPGMFAAQTLADGQYWDGGIADPVPFEQWIDDPAIETILIHLVVNQDELKSRQAGLQKFLPGLGLAHQIISDEIFRLKCKLARRAGKRLLVLKTITPRSGPNRLHLGQRNVEYGRKTVRRNLELLRALK